RRTGSPWPRSCAATASRRRRSSAGGQENVMQAVVVAPGEGRFIAVGSAGTGGTVKVSAAETDGLCTVWEGRVPPGTVGAGPHFHRGRDEFFYVLEGEVVLRVGHES